MSHVFRKIYRFSLAHGIITWLALILVWYVLSLFYNDTFLPGPLETLNGAKSLLFNGNLLSFSAISLRRVLIGWSLGTLVAIPLGLCIGRIKFIHSLVEPIINFFRFIPGLAFLTVFLMWFGVGETSKIVLIFYSTVFTVTVNTIAGVTAVSPERINSARVLGVTNWQLLRTVIWPSIIPHVFTGARLGLGGAFGAIVAAEMLAANEGLGYLIYSARLYFHTDWIFAGIICLGLLGYFTDLLLRTLGNHLLKHYGVTETISIND